MNELLKFTPILKPVIWGGSRLAPFKGLASPMSLIGESWELSPLEGMESVVAEGVFKGKSLSKLTDDYADDILGERLARLYDKKFPLLIKFLDTADNLSIQVHPDNDIAARRHNCFGKTEMWYSIAPEEDSYIYAGFSEQVDATSFRRCIRGNKVVEILNKYYTRPGDMLMLPAGRIHSIGAGNLLYEVQQASDITYRVYDYDRSDANGKRRELHVEEGIEALNFDDCGKTKICNMPPETGKTKVLAKCDFFTVELTGVEEGAVMDFADRDSFTCLTAIAGEMTVEGPSNTMLLRQGETILVPASVGMITIKGSGSLISVFVD